MPPSSHSREGSQEDQERKLRRGGRESSQLRPTTLCILVKGPRLPNRQGPRCVTSFTEGQPGLGTSKCFPLLNLRPRDWPFSICSFCEIPPTAARSKPGCPTVCHPTPPCSRPCFVPGPFTNTTLFDCPKSQSGASGGYYAPHFTEKTELTRQGADLAFYPRLLASKAHGFFGVWQSISDI